MSPISRPRPRTITALAVVMAFLLSAGLTAEQNVLKRMVGADTNVKYQPFKDSAGRFELEYPSKDWKLLPSGSSSLAVFARNDGPTLYVDHVRLLEPLTPPEIAGMPAVELSSVKDQQPKAKDFKSDMFDCKTGRGVLIRYSREGGGGPETVVQYSIAVGPELFRINGIMPDKQVQKYEPIIMYMIQSFRAPAASTSKQ
jgi:hypothetical protein